MTRWRILALLSAAELLGMSLWFTASAVSPQLAELWGLTVSEAGWLTTTVQLGFVAGTASAAALNLPDLIPDRRYFAASAVLAAASNAAILMVPSYGGALLFRFLTGFFLAGVYPPAMKMIATWFRSGRGLAIGTIVGALTIGKALPYLVHALERASVAVVVGTASTGAAAAGLLVFVLYRPGPEAFERRPFSWRLVGTVLSHRPTRLAVLGYLGHMWELYAFWTLAAAYLAQAFAAGSAGGVAGAERFGSMGAFAAIAAGGVGAVVAGRWADRWGRERVASAAMVLSGSCALVAGWLIGVAPWIVVVIALVWGFAVVADSAQFSALVTEVAPRHAVGTALTIQTSLGFGLTAVSIWLAVELSGRGSWGLAFSLLAIGPALGILAMRRLEAVRTVEGADGGGGARGGGRPDGDGGPSGPGGGREVRRLEWPVSGR